VTSWVNPTSVLGGVLAVLVCAYLAAVFLCADAVRDGEQDIADGFRIRALGTAAVTGLGGLIGLFVLRADAPALAAGLFGRALPVLVISVLAGVASIALLVLRRYAQARLTSALAVATILIGWAAAQYPYILPPTLTIEDAAAGQVTLVAMLVSLIIGSILLVPSLIYLYRLFQRAGTDAPASYPGPG
jgi:cytochrome bd ubiquinol oxidase subunit II